MKIYVVILVIITSAFLCAGMGTELELAKRNQLHSNNVSRDFITIISEDFENGAEDWETFDETGMSDWIEYWHLSTTGAYEGNSWWMGDEELGGYTDSRYLVLDTPELVLADDNPELHFWFSLCCEDVGGDPPYDAWDGANIRISTDGGESWSVLAGTPEYNAESFYSYGYEFGEGEGIPGWGSTTEWVNWTEAAFSLNAYAGESVKIRFAFASDPAYNTGDDASMFGFRLDDIAIDTSTGIFESNGDGASGDSEMIAGYGVTSTGNLWHIYEDSEAPSPTHAMGCFDEETDTYLPGMDNYIITPEFYLPAGGDFFWDVDVMVMIDDDSTFPECDYLVVEKSFQSPEGNWSPWFMISYPGPHVFTGNTETWLPFTEHWSTQYSNISDYAGRNVKLRFGLHSNATDEVVPGGFRIDDFIVQQEVYLGPAPRNLVAVMNDENQVELSWDAISEGGSEGWIQWDNGVNDDAIGLTNAGTMYTAASFDPGDMMPYVGGEITQVELYINDLPSSMILHVWSGPNAATEIISQTFTATGMNWVIIDLDTPVTIESGTEYWVGYEVTQAIGQFCCGVDAGPAIVENGDWVALSPGAWQSMAGLGLNYNWNIHAYVDGGRVTTKSTPTLSRDVTGYNVWWSLESGGDYENIATVDPSDTPTYLDEYPTSGAWNFYVVTALYDGLDGAASDEVLAYRFPEEFVELAYDDGSCEEGLNVGTAQYMAVKFTPPCNYIRFLTHLNIYIETLNSGQFVFRILEGSTGLPGEMLAQFNVTPDNLHTGWNIIEFPEISIPDSTSECFFISIFEMAYLSAIGKDTNTAGNSWMTTGQEHNWEEITDGNMMLRTYIYPYDGSDAIELAPASTSISCYPNPFNPQTTISFTTEDTHLRGATARQAENTEISIYNTKGQRIRSFIIHNSKSKIKSVVWDGKDSQNRSCATGIYFCRVKAGKQMATSKILLLK